MIIKENTLHKLINNTLFIYSIEHKDLLFYTYIPFDEKRTSITGSLLKAKGTKKGVPDFMLIFENDIIVWIECKTIKAKQISEQKEFENMINNKTQNQRYYVAGDLEYLKVY